MQERDRDLSEQNLADYFRLFFEKSVDPILLLDGEKFLGCNEAAVRMLKCAGKQQLLGLHPAELSPERQPDGELSYEKAQRIMAEVFRIGSKRFEWVHRNMEGQKIWMDISLTAIPFYGKQYLYTVWRDISDHKRSEQELLAAHKRMSDIIEFLPDATFVIDQEKRVIAWNKAIETTTGIKKEAMLGKGDHAYAVPFYGERRPIAIDFAMAGNEEAENSYVSIEKEGDTIYAYNFTPMPHLKNGGAYLWGIASPLLDVHGNAIGAIESIRDVTEQRLTQQALTESEERYRIAIEQSNDGVAMVQGEKHIYVNKKFLKIFGFDSLDEVIGQPVVSIIHPDDRKKVMTGQGTNNGLREYQFRGLRKDGNTVFIEASQTQTKYKGRTTFLVYLRDITERKNLQTQLLQSQKMEAIGTLAGGVAHDFNNILMAIIGYAHLMQATMPEAHPFKTYAQEITNCASKAANVTRSLLAFSRKQTMQLQPSSVNMLLQDLEKLLKRLVPEDVTFTMSLHEDMIIMADMTQIDQVLINLVSNAKDAMPKGGTLHIEAKGVEIGKEFRQAHGFGEPGGYAMISVADTGSGIDEAIQKKIFEPFFTTKEVGKGTGLGLSIVYGIIKQHKGYITVSSELGEGTTFEIYLPTVEIGSAQQKQASAPAPGGSETILLAEDDSDVRQTVKEILRVSGYTILEAKDGGDAVKQYVANKDKVDLLILDVVMPQKNGKEAFEEIHNIDPAIPVLFMSGYTGDIVLDKGVQDLAVNYIPKPISADDLLKKIRDVLGNNPSG